MSRVSFAKLLEVGASLDARERELVREVARLRLMTHTQLAALLGVGGEASPVSAARANRRVLARLTQLRVLARLGRRIGGVRRGSAGYLYYLGPVGQRLVAYWDGHGLVRGRFRPEPADRYVRHRLAVSELYVEARLAQREGNLDLLAFDVEPDCWRKYLDGCGRQQILKPDAYARVGVGAYEDRYFVEVDLGSESRTVVARKLRAYLDYWGSGQEQQAHGVFPRVLWLTTTQTRECALDDLCRQLPHEGQQLFSVAQLPRATEVLSGEVAGDSPDPEPEPTL